MLSKSGTPNDPEWLKGLYKALHMWTVALYISQWKSPLKYISTYIFMLDNIITPKPLHFNNLLYQLSMLHVPYPVVGHIMSCNALETTRNNLQMLYHMQLNWECKY